MEMTIKVPGLEALAASMAQLAAAMTAETVISLEPETVPPTAPLAAPQANPAPSVPPTQRPVPIAPPAAGAPIIPVTAVAQSYGREQIVRALVTAKDLGQGGAVAQVLAANRVDSAMDLPETSFGGIATFLQQLGVQV